VNKNYLLISFCLYLIFLFLIAKYFESKHYSNLKQKRLFDKLVYIFGFGAYCTTWTYYGSIEGVTSSGVKFLTVYLGPALSSILWALLLRRVIRLKERHGITNIPDLLNVLYQDSKSLSKLVTVFFTIGLIPYVALQLKSVTRTTQYILNKSVDNFQSVDYLVALSFILFTTYFSNKNIQDSKDRHGLSAIIAVESVVKLIGILIVGIFVTYYKFDGLNDIFESSKELIQSRIDSSSFVEIPKMSSWVSLTFLSFFAFLFLPRQFHMGVVENRNINDVYSASWTVPLYLFLINIFIIPIAIYGMFYTNGELSPDLYLLGIPFQEGLRLISIIVFLGGYSAAAGMVVLEVTTLSTMLTNSVILPILQKRNSSLTSNLLAIKRSIMIILIIISYLYMTIAGNKAALISMGLISFACVFQLAPTIIGGLLWKKAHLHGAMASIITGIIIWSYTLFIPAFLKDYSYTKSILVDGPMGISFLNPYCLFGISTFDSVTHSIFWSIIVSVPVYIYFSLRGYNRDLKKKNRYSDEVFSESLEGFQIATKDLKIRLNKLFAKYFTKEDIELIWKDLDDVMLSNKENINYDDFMIIVNRVQITLFETIGAVAAKEEIKHLLTKRELDIFEHTNQQEMQKQIIAQEKLSSMSELTSGLAHELVNPLNILINANKLMTEQIRDQKANEDITQINKMISSNLERTNDIVQRMLSMSKSEKVEFVEDDLQGLLHSLRDISITSAKEKYYLTLNIEIKTLSMPRNFNFSKTEIENMFSYILENSLQSLAIKSELDKDFNPKLIISVNYFLNRVRIDIHDNGHGIEKENIGRVLNPFYTSRPTGKGNLGLGLSRASDIITAHKGSILIESEYLEWTKIVITLPYS
jgi:Na+/proline symporter/nitrogen-specific signal transduction histidine kinase